MCENEKNKMRVLQDFIGFSIEPSHYLNSRGLVYSRNTLPPPPPPPHPLRLNHAHREKCIDCSNSRRNSDTLSQKSKAHEHCIELVNINLDYH